MTHQILPPTLSDLHLPRTQRKRVKRVRKNGELSIGFEHRGRAVQIEPHPSGAGIFIRFVMPIAEVHEDQP